MFLPSTITFMVPLSTLMVISPQLPHWEDLAKMVVTLGFRRLGLNMWSCGN